MKLSYACILLFTATSFASDVVVNDGFETEDTLHWIETGSVPFHHKGVVMFNVKSPTNFSWTYYQHPGDGVSGGLQQTIHLIKGVVYEVSADILYHNG
jgi:hypothetical protein